MLIALFVPDETVSILYITKVQNENYTMESDPRKITFNAPKPRIASFRQHCAGI